MNFDGKKKGSLSEGSAVSQWLVCTRLVGDLEMVTSASVWVKLERTPHGHGGRGPTETRAPAGRLKDLLVRVGRARPLSPKPLFSQKGDFLFLAWPSPPPDSAERNRGQTGWRQVPSHMSPSATREENERGGNARFRILPPVKHAGGSVHKHRLKQINQTWPKATEKATDASN